jgi:two-component system response regulator (stage 0 sporulation protein A)
LTYNQQIVDEVERVLESLQIPQHYKGYSYLKDAILVTISNPGLINEVTKKLYPLIASGYRTNQHRVERAMRFAIETAWNKGNVDVLHEMFGYCVDEHKGKPTNASFIAKIADQIRITHKSMNVS